VERARAYTHGEGTFIHEAPCANTCMATNMFGRPVLHFIPAFVYTHVHTSCTYSAFVHWCHGRPVLHFIPAFVYTRVHTSCTYSAFVRWCHHLLFFSRPCSGIPSSQGPRPSISCLASLAHTFCNVGIINQKCVHECAAQDIHTHTYEHIGQRN
jgi:hypothetical protein